MAAGVRRVVYIEPYEKSQALDLHDDAITVEDLTDPARADGEHDRDRGPRKVVFEPFEKHKSDGTKAKWAINGDAVVRVPMPPTSYLDREAQLAQLVMNLLEETL